MESASKLLDAAVREIQRNMRAPAVAIYSAEKQGYKRLRQTGADEFPEELDIDDAALAALRTERAAVELPDVGSALGDDGCVFPMNLLGNLRGALVCSNRPSVHYAMDEKTLLTQVASDVGAALRIHRRGTGGRQDSGSCTPRAGPHHASGTGGCVSLSSATKSR